MTATASLLFCMPAAQCSGEGVLDEGEQYLPGLGTLPRIAGQSGDVRVEVEGGTDVAEAVTGGAVEAVDGEDERQAAFLEVVDGGKAVAETAGIGQDNGAERAVGQFVPHEPEALLPGSTEQVQ